MKFLIITWKYLQIKETYYIALYTGSSVFRAYDPTQKKNHKI